jgi:4'-phosphopantetheinyl transferase
LVSIPDDNTVHLWRFDPRAAPAADHRASLDATENVRAAEFRNEVARSRFVVCRGTLRQILGSYLALALADVPIMTGPKGKPQLAAPQILAFNLSHCEDLALLAVAAHGTVGVDVEPLREVPRASDLAKRYFSTEEQQELAKAPPSELSERYLTYWTRKEACVKAWGIGIAANLARFSVAVNGKVITLPNNEHSELHVKTFQLKRDHVAAVALERDFSIVDLGRWVE